MNKSLEDWDVPDTRTYTYHDLLKAINRTIREHFESDGVIMTATEQVHFGILCDILKPDYLGLEELEDRIEERRGQSNNI